MDDSDPRRGLPSASMMHRLSKCSGSLALTNQLRKSGMLYELTDPDAESGTRIHGWLAAKLTPGAILPELTSNELIVAEKAWELRSKIVERWRDNDGNYIVQAEKRSWYRQGILPRFSGKPDFVSRDDRQALVINYKTGRIEADAAADNLQLRSEVVLLKNAVPELEEIDAAIVEPWVTWESVRVRYTEGTLQEAEAQILAICDDALWHQNTRTAGPWCVHCPARAHCREALDYIQTIPNPQIEKAVVELPRGERGVELWEKIQLAKKLLGTLEETYERILEDEPQALPGYILPAQGRERRLVPYPARLKAALAQYLTPDEIDGCAEYYLGKIEELLGIKHRIGDKKQLKSLFTATIRDAVTITHDKPFIRKLTKRERDTAGKIIEAKAAFAEA